MTITTEQIVEASAKAMYERPPEPGIAWERLDSGVRVEYLIDAQAAYDAMLPLIRKQLADEVRRQCFTSEGAKFAIRQGRSVGEIQEFDAALEFAASLIEEGL